VRTHGHCASDSVTIITGESASIVARTTSAAVRPPDVACSRPHSRCMSIDDQEIASWTARRSREDMQCKYRLVQRAMISLLTNSKQTRRQYVTDDVTSPLPQLVDDEFYDRRRRPDNKTIHHTQLLCNVVSRLR